jgi:hypothetical protein
MSDTSDVYVILDDINKSKKPSLATLSSSATKEISLDDHIYESIDDDRDDPRASRHTRNVTRDAAPVVSITPETSQPPRRRVLVAEGICSFSLFFNHL